jgi:hypothetical protein
MTATGTTQRRARDRLTPSLAQPPLLFLRIALGIAAAAMFGSMAVVTFVVGSVLTTGCFMSCDEPNLLAGIPTLVAAAGLAALGIAALWWGAVDGHWSSAWRVLAVVGAAGAVVLVTATLATA